MFDDPRVDLFTLSFKTAQIRRGRAPAFGGGGGFGTLLVKEFAFRLRLAFDPGEDVACLFDSLLCRAALGFRCFGLAQGPRSAFFQLAAFLLQTSLCIHNHAPVTLSALN